MSVQMQAVASSMISAAGYDEATHTLHLSYANGRTYEYPGVPLDKYEAMLRAPSVGQYVNAQIKPYHAHRS